MTFPNSFLINFWFRSVIRVFATPSWRPDSNSVWYFIVMLLPLMLFFDEVSSTIVGAWFSLEILGLLVGQKLLLLYLITWISSLERGVWSYFTVNDCWWISLFSSFKLLSLLLLAMVKNATYFFSDIVLCHCSFLVSSFAEGFTQCRFKDFFGFDAPCV